MKHIIPFLIIAVLSSTLASAEPVRVHFSPNSPDSLQTVVNRLNDGDVLIIEPGNYQLAQPVTIRRNIDIVGSPEGMPTIRGRNGCFVIEVTQRTGDQRVTLGNLNLIVNSGVVAEDSEEYLSAVHVRQGTVRIVQCELTSDGGFGLSVLGNSSRAEIVRSKVSRCAEMGIAFGENATGLIEETEISANMYGGIVIETANVSISNSQISGNMAIGIDIAFGSNVTISNSRVLNNSEQGIVIEEDSQVTITDCRIDDNAMDGIHVASRGRVTVSNSQISNNAVGIAVGDGGRGTFEGNRFQGNTHDWFIGEDAGEVVRRNNTPQ